MTKEEIYDFVTSESTTTAVLENSERDDRRNSAEEKEQKAIINKLIKEIAKEYPNVSPNFVHFESISKGQGKDSKCVFKNGSIAHSTEEDNPFEHSKAFDGVVYFRNNKTNTYVDVYFFLKSTKSQGGYQSTNRFEVQVTEEYFERNKDKSKNLVFMLEGEFWDSYNKKYSLNDYFGCEKMFYATRDNMKEILISILKNHKVI